MEFERSSKGISNIREVLKVLQGCFMEVSRVFQENFKGISRKIKGCFNGVSSRCQGRLNEVKWMFEGMFQECFNEILFCDFVVAQIHRSYRAEGGMVRIFTNWIGYQQG